MTTEEQRAEWARLAKAHRDAAPYSNSKFIFSAIDIVEALLAENANLRLTVEEDLKYQRKMEAENEAAFEKYAELSQRVDAVRDSALARAEKAEAENETLRAAVDAARALVKGRSMIDPDEVTAVLDEHLGGGE